MDTEIRLDTPIPSSADTPQKFCARCRHSKPITEFKPAESGKFGCMSTCAVCTDIINENKRRKRLGLCSLAASMKPRTFPGLVYGSVEYQKASNLKHSFGLSLEEYNKMFSQQKGCCKICGLHQTSLARSLSVDHNHSTNAIRGLLCDKCNIGLGHFKDDLSLLLKAVEYLTEN